MGAVNNIWNAKEVAEAPDNSAIQIRFSSQSVDPSLPLPQITPLVTSVSHFLHFPVLRFQFFSPEKKIKRRVIRICAVRIDLIVICLDLQEAVQGSVQGMVGFGRFSLLRRDGFRRHHESL